MKKTLALYKMWLKLALKSVPFIICGTLVFAAFVAGTAFAGVKLLSGRDDTNKIPAALVVNDDNTYTQMAISYLLEEESLKEICTFAQMDEEEAWNALKKGQVSAVIVIPENFMTGVLYGGDVTAQLILSDNDMTSQSKSFRKMIQSGAMDLITAQAAIYAVDDLCYAAGIDAVRESEEYLNVNLLMYALRRNAYFGKIVISDTGDLTLAQFYTAGGIVLLLFFSGITCGELLKKEEGTFISSIYRVGIRPHTLLSAKLLASSAVYVGLAIFIYSAAVLRKAVPFTFAALPAVVIIIFTVFSINLLLFQLAGNKTAGTLAGFLAAIVMMFLSGNFIPVSFLPKLVNDIGSFMPTKWITALCGQVLTGEILWQNMIICMFILVTMVMIALLFQAADRKIGR